MQNFGVDLEGRSYVALDTSTSGDAGGYSAPIMFWAEVIHQMKQYDQLFDACRWITTARAI